MQQITSKSLVLLTIILMDLLNCILTLKISESYKLVDVATGNEVGRLIKSAYEENNLGPYKGP